MAHNGKTYEDGVRTGMEMAVDVLWELRGGCGRMGPSINDVICAVSARAIDHFGETNWRRGYSAPPA